MTILLTEGWEQTDDPTFTYSKWEVGGLDIAGAGNTLTYSNINQHHGSYCLRSLVAAGNSGNNGWCSRNITITGYNPIYGRTYVLVDQLPPANASVRFMNVSDGAGGRSAIAYVGIKNIGGVPTWMVRRRSAGSFADFLGTACEINKIYCVEFGFFWNDSSAGWIKVWVNGKINIHLTGLDHSRNLDNIAFGQVFSSANAANDTSAYHDCIVVSTDEIGCENPLHGLRVPAKRTKRSRSGRGGRLYLK